MKIPHFYRINAAEFYAKIDSFCNKDLNKFIRKFASDLVKGSSTDAYTNKIIQEAEISIKKRSDAGKKSADKRFPDRHI